MLKEVSAAATPLIEVPRKIGASLIYLIYFVYIVIFYPYLLIRNVQEILRKLEFSQRQKEKGKKP